MKMLVALLTLLLLCVNGVHGDCQDDCLSCSRILPKQLTFNTMECLLECEASDTLASSWETCRRSLSLSSMPKRSQEEVEALFPEEVEEVEGENDGEGLPLALQRLDRITQVLDDRDADTHDSLSLDDESEDSNNDNMALSVSKRFGGFVKGRHSYRKLIAPARSYQKRYGGFIGIRKSARKWNNQKRFSEFLKQYLGMSTRATEYNSVSEELSHHNEV
ncbi:prepronociceptin [Corythoichthys intestinalis]|uniref:prepronociceptin n=1 Tax=Corythoichthys intestinalis TaxID=161448 RepID=UPI0025A63410|nr:prepronociceptin [Corythoichthys intestinalis]XP_061795970.1 prepronociceptin-like [Nerophis lumbriciformis]